MKYKRISDLSFQGKYKNLLLAKKLDELNLDFIKNRMVARYGWEESRADNAIFGYKKYLYTTQVLSVKISPSIDVDEIWHQHILHTKDYAKDCEFLFGFFLHHVPNPVKIPQKNNLVVESVGCSCDALCESAGNCAPETGSCENNDPFYEVLYSSKKSTISFDIAIGMVFN